MRRLLVLGLSTLAACGSDPEVGEVERSTRDPFGIITCSGEGGGRTCLTHRAILGVSMGASGAGQIGFAHPELFDTVGMLGIPLLDWTYMLRVITSYHLGGFCDRETILANVDRLEEVNGPAFCGPIRGVDKLEPTGTVKEPDQDFNHFYLAVSDGAGPGFGRDSLFHAFRDLSSAFGNFFYPPNPDAPDLPLGISREESVRSDRERCQETVKVEGLRHWKYNPDGAYPAITFCDTSTDGPNFSPAKIDEPVGIALAIDFNRNGRRDYAEPVVLMSSERYEDVGKGESDVYDWKTNPAGTRQNALWDQGEPYEDTGLDGIAGTNDYGEGNGKFDYSRGVDSVFSQNPRFLVSSMPEEQLRRLNVYADAGLRDSILSAGGTNWFWAQLERRLGSELVRSHADFLSLIPGEEDYDFLKVDYSPKGIGKDAYVRYGKVNATPRDIQRGDGGHVGPGDQILERLLTSIAFTESRMYQPDRRVVQDPGSFDDFVKLQSFPSKALGEEQAYGIMLPPGYFDSDERYPVVYFLHGQGQDFNQMLASAILFFGYQAESNRPEVSRKRESDWAKFIMVFPNSQCREGDCRDGTFNTNHPDGVRYGDVFFELMAHVEETYRVRVPVELPVEDAPR
ncbi:MAG: hypothetical protein HY791_08920 [Deltaproteobacteria bacterium]|nr:hypothetical protein [Deltaproteobacteria bacterium]